MKYKYLFRVMSLLVLIISFFPVSRADALTPTPTPLADMFQLPWDQGIAWVAIDGLDNGSKRPLSSSHNFTVGGAIDFAPHNNMVKGEDTSNFWVAAAGAGTVVGISGCHVTIAHASGWITEYQFLATIQVKLGDAVNRNQRLGIIADGVKYKFCPGSVEPNVPHVHFMLRPSLIGATLAGWVVGYSSSSNITTFTKNGQTLGLFKPLLNVLDATPTPTATQTVTGTPASDTPTASVTPSPTQVMSPTPTLFGPYVSTTVDPLTISVGESALVTVSLNNVPAEGYTSAEFTCDYDASLAEVSNITVTNLFGADAAVAINGPQNNRFIVAIAGSSGNKATTSGAVFTFSIKGLQVGQTQLGCEARVSKGDNMLNQLPSARTSLTILGDTTSTPTLDLTPSATPTITAIPSETGTPASSTPTLPSTACDKVQMISDVTIPDGTVMLPGATFTKTWRLKNVGTCNWTTSYQLVFFSGEQMGGSSPVNLPQNVLVGQTVDISINLTAPNAPGSYRGYWMFKNPDGALFGIGAQANNPWWVDIRVSGSTDTPGPIVTQPSDSPTPSATPEAPTHSPTPSVTPDGATATPLASAAYDFAANACAATWTSGAGQLPCPGIDGDPKGFVLKLSNPKLETGVTDTRPGLVTFPQNVQNGYIQGFYPPFKVQNGDRFRSIVNCEFGATSCYLAFRLDYQVGNDPIKTFWGPFLERYEGLYYSADIDLSPLAGQDVKFILTVLASGPATGDRALWVGPHIYRSNVSTPTATPAGDWLVFTNSKYGFQFQYPPQGQIVAGGNDNFTRINLPFAPGTNLGEKYLQVDVVENANPCRSPVAASSIVQSSETVTLNGITFLKETGQEPAAGNLYQFVAYSTFRDNVCVSLSFVLHSVNPGNFSTPIPVFDYAAESAVFGQIVSTYNLIETATPTPTGSPAPAESETPTVTPTSGSFPTPFESPTVTSTLSSSPTPSGNNGAVAGQITTSKPVTVNVYDANNTLVATMETTPDGRFRLEVSPGTYTVVASEPGFLRAQGTVTLTTGNTIILPLTLLAGDIDGNDVIDQFDALTIGMNYNTNIPEVADLNDDGTINVLDLELLAKNYRKTGPIDWE